MRGEGGLQAYLRQALMNRVRDYARQAGRRPVTTGLDTGMDPPARSPVEQAVGQQVLDRYEDALSRLRDMDRELVVARVELGLDVDEIAAAFDKPTPAGTRKAVARASVAWPPGIAAAAGAMVLESPEFDDEDEALLDSLEPLAENLAGGIAVDWVAADSSELTASHKALLRQLRAVALIASAHERFAREADDLLPDAVPVAQGELRTWGKQILRSYLGRGSFGDVYRAWDPRLDREVALKLLTPSVTTETARSSTVISEGRALARVRHPNVVTVYGADRSPAASACGWSSSKAGRWRSASPLTARSRRPRRPRSVPIAVADAVHRAGLLHRDVKAQNVMCEAGGHIVLTDFGTAVPHGEGQPVDNGGGSEGTPPVDTPQSAITWARDARGNAAVPRTRGPRRRCSDGAQRHLFARRAAVPRADRDLPRDRPNAARGARPPSRRPAQVVVGGTPGPAPGSRVHRDWALDPDRAARFQTADEMAVSLGEVARARARRTTWGVAAAIAVATLSVVAAWLVGVIPFRSSGLVPPKGPDLVLVASFENTTGDTRFGQLVERAATEAVTGLGPLLLRRPIA